MTYLLYVRQPGQWFFRKYLLKGQSNQNGRLVLELKDGTFRDIPSVDQCEFKFGTDLIEARQALATKEKASDVPGPQE